MSKVFVSYARPDEVVVRQIIEDIRNAGHEVFVDSGITGGQQWWDTILNQIQQSAVFMPVLSSRYLSSEPCRLEADWAFALGIPLVPLDVGPSSPAQFAEPIARAQWIRYDSQDRRTLGLIYQAIANAGPVRSPATAPNRPSIPVSYLERLGYALRADDDISRHQQIVILTELQRRLANPVDEADARELLSLLAHRPEVTVDVHRQIRELLDRQPRYSGFYPTEESVPPRPANAPPGGGSDAASGERIRSSRKPGAKRVRIGLALIPVGLILVLVGWGDDTNAQHLSNACGFIALVIAVVLLVSATWAKLRTRRDSQRLRTRATGS